ncbi:HesB/IscA family protein [Bradyrhizobium diversitatis]|uniref:Iron-sulfur cluster assembly accessory protein n=1 Tax=Bradyrhizobium diversitatis TaxID=2755406 RepID=A0ABS0P816_9BRAD|nr:iron-sulfur cluster assembly accessory protein [Bradyrhizobium diversitatis]MBH5389401.1 iron-sulfur cluster assembly accessory protein [Bradyrhizobium diversitatis]
MINLTDNALNAVRGVISTSGASGLRITVESGGCASFKYIMGLANETKSDDNVIERDGIKLFVDNDSHKYLAGTTIDFVLAQEGSGFTFDNPNANASCSCGKSFS